MPEVSKERKDKNLKAAEKANIEGLKVQNADLKKELSTTRGKLTKAENRIKVLESKLAAAQKKG